MVVDLFCGETCGAGECGVADVVVLRLPAAVGGARATAGSGMLAVVATGCIQACSGCSEFCYMASAMSVPSLFGSSLLWVLVVDVVWSSSMRHCINCRDTSHHSRCSMGRGVSSVPRVLAVKLLLPFILIIISTLAALAITLFPLLPPPSIIIVR